MHTDRTDIIPSTADAGGKNFDLTEIFRVSIVLLEGKKMVVIFQDIGLRRTIPK